MKVVLNSYFCCLFVTMMEWNSYEASCGLEDGASFIYDIGNCETQITLHKIYVLQVTIIYDKK